MDSSITPTMASIKQSRTSEVVRFIHVDAEAGKKFDGIHPVLFCSYLQQRVAVDFLVDISAERVEREKMLLVAIWKSVEQKQHLLHATCTHEA